MFNNMQSLVPMTISQFFAPRLQHKNHPRDFLPIPQELANDTCSQHPLMQAMTCGYRHCFIVFKRLKNVKSIAKTLFMPLCSKIQYLIRSLFFAADLLLEYLTVSWFGS